MLSILILPKFLHGDGSECLVPAGHAASLAPRSPPQDAGAQHGRAARERQAIPACPEKHKAYLVPAIGGQRRGNRFTEGARPEARVAKIEVRWLECTVTNCLKVDGPRLIQEEKLHTKVRQSSGIQ
jgi:hypothetical protein